MHPYLIDLGWFKLRIYGLAIATGVLVATYFLYFRARRLGMPWADRVFELAFWAVLGGIAGARAWEVLFTWDYYRHEPWRVLAVWEGGISIQGGVLGGLLAAWLWARRQGVDLWTLADLAIPGVVLAQGIGRIGCIFNGDAYGIPIAQTWLPRWLGVVYAPGTPAYLAYGATPLVPAEAFEGLADYLICLFLLTYRPRRPVAGWRVLAYFILYSCVRFLLEFWRGDSLRAGPGLKAAQLLAAASAVVATALWLYRARRAPAAPAAS